MISQKLLSEKQTWPKIKCKRFKMAKKQHLVNQVQAAVKRVVNSTLSASCIDARVDSNIFYVELIIKKCVIARNYMIDAFLLHFEIFQFGTQNKGKAMYESMILLLKFKGKKVWKYILALRIKYSHNCRTRLATELCKFLQNPLNSAAQIYLSSSFFLSLLTFVQNPLNSAAQIHLSSSSFSSLLVQNPLLLPKSICHLPLSLHC